MKYAIVAGGEFQATPRIEKILADSERIVCADGGAGHLRKLGLLPHVLIGDFDSIDPDDKAYFTQHHVELIRYPVRKDQTDSELCVDWAVAQGATEITLLGVTGSRLDHTLANIFLLKKMADHAISARIISPNNDLYLVKDTITLTAEPGQLLSVIPITQTIEGLFLEGLEYDLSDAVISMGSSLGISNRFIRNKATVSIGRGLALVILSRD